MLVRHDTAAEAEDEREDEQHTHLSRAGLPRRGGVSPQQRREPRAERRDVETAA